MLNLILALIQTSLKMSLSRFMKMRKIVQNKAEKANLGRKILRINQMRKNLNRLAEQIMLRVQKHMKCSNVK